MNSSIHPLVAAAIIVLMIVAADAFVRKEESLYAMLRRSLG